MNGLPKYFLSSFLLVFFCFCFHSYSYAAETQAQNLDAQITISDGSDASVLKDQYVSSKLTLAPGAEIQIQAPSEIGAIYLIWDNPVSGWTLQVNGETSLHGQYGFLHEYTTLESPNPVLTIRIPESGAVLCDIIVLSPGTPPPNIQVWEPPCQKADLLLLSTHADDEHLFFGGTMPYYAGEKKMRVQLVYFCSHTANEPYREHEKLNGMWMAGVKNYPIMGDFPDEYSTSLETALTQYNYDEAVAFIVTQLRRFQPLVVLGQDLNGEYGHGTHRLTAKALTDAVQLSNQADYQPQTASQYEPWDVPKTYLHLYPENRIHMNWNIPLESFGGQTALQMADAGYKTHESQQWCWFYVSDSYEYSCAEFGLFRSLVGPDIIGGDFMENLIPYDQRPEETTAPSTEETTLSKTTASSSQKEESLLQSSKQSKEHTEQLSTKSEKETSYPDAEIASHDFKTFLSFIKNSPISTILICSVIVAIVTILIVVCKKKK